MSRHYRILLTKQAQNLGGNAIPGNLDKRYGSLTQQTYCPNDRCR